MSTVPGAAAPAAHRGTILTIVLASYFMILLDSSVVFTALPGLQADLGLTASRLSWVQDAYTLVFGGLLLLGARAGDLLGRRRVFVLGLAVFTLASLLIGLAPTGGWIVAGRALQGIGAAVVAPSSLSLLTASFPEGPDRSRAVAWYGATAGIGASLGLVVGGACAHLLSWRAGFFLNVPIGIAMMLLAPRYLPESPTARGRFDLVGAVTATLGVGALVLAVVHAAESGWSSPVTIGALVAGAVLLWLLVANESRAVQPILPLRLFASRERTGAYLARFCYLGAMVGFFYFTTQLLQEVLGWNPLQAGLGFLPMTTVNFAVAMGIPRLTRRVGGTVPLVAGITVTLAGLYWLSRVQVGDGYLTGIALPMLLVGAGQGLAFAPLTSAGISGATAQDAGAASGLMNTFHQVGMSLGLAVLVAVAARVPRPAGRGVDQAATLVARVDAALTAGSVLLVLSLVAALALIVPQPWRARPAVRPPGSPAPTPRG
ncbi:MAG TPA: MFS transporter [Cellulomonas sp.]